MFHIAQITTVEDYVSRFSARVDQIAAYETKLDPLHYTSRFLDGLKPAVRVLVAIQQPSDLDTAYTLALLYEELGDGCTPLNSNSGHSHSHSSSRRPSPLPQPPPPPPAKWISKIIEEKKQVEGQRSSYDDKWTSLKAYRRSKGLCFTCGEKWGKDHQCKTAIQLHVVREMIDYMQSNEGSDSDSSYSSLPEQQALMLSLAALNPNVVAPKSMQLLVTIQGHQMLFLVDSGSSSCFIDIAQAALQTGATQLQKTVGVKVAGGDILHCTAQFQDLEWSSHGALFTDTFRVISLGSYHGIHWS